MTRSSWWWLQIGAGAAAGLWAGALFVIGHDACHQSFTRRRHLNDAISRVCLLTSYHPVASWEHTHNGLHHGWTNIKGMDPVYAPQSWEEYNALGAWERIVHRLSRTTLGMPLLYLWNIYFPLELFPRNADWPKARRVRFRRDRWLVILFLIIQIAAVAWWNRDGGWSVLALSYVAAFIVPLGVFHWLMGFATFLHHTNPRVPWFRDADSWSYQRGQIECVVHAEFPRIIELLLHNIMDHTAHHADTAIPLYRLHESQRALEQALGPRIVRVPFSVRGWREILRTCRLYDYDRHQWLDWNGSPTSSPILVAGVLRAEGICGTTADVANRTQCKQDVVELSETAPSATG